MSSKNLKKTTAIPSTARSGKAPKAAIGDAPGTRRVAPQADPQAEPVTIEIAESLATSTKAATPRPSRKKAGPAAPRAARAPRPKPTPVAQALASDDANRQPAAGPAAAPRVITDEDIRVRAYFLSLEHRARGGSDIDFWLIAERELRGGMKN